MITNITDFRKILETKDINKITIDVKVDNNLRYWADIYSDDVLIGNCRRHTEIIKLDLNPSGRTRSRIYYVVSWDRDKFKDKYGVPANNLKKLHGHVNALETSKPPTALKIQRYINEEITKINTDS